MKDLGKRFRIALPSIIACILACVVLPLVLDIVASRSTGIIGSLKHGEVEIWDNPILLPGFLMDTDPDAGSAVSKVGEICATLNQGAFWEPGVFEDELSQHLTYNTSLVVNNRIFANDIINRALNRNRLSVLEVMTLMTEYNDEGEIIGGWGGPLTFCARSPLELEAGFYVATITATSVSGVEHSYSWAFRFQDVLESEP